MHFKKALIPEYIFFIIILVFICFVRFRFSDMAMERDEGEYAYAAAEILRGGFPYLDFYNMKLPGVYYFYATIFFLFGKSIPAVRFCVLLLNIFNCFFIQKIAEKWFDERAGWLAAGVYLLAAVGTRSQGLVSNCEHFVLFFFLITLFSLTRRAYFIAGLSAALCIMMKQQGAILLGFAFVYFCYEVYINRKNPVAKTTLSKVFWAIAMGFLIPFAVLLLGIWQKNALVPFQYFVVDYARAYAGLNKPTPFYFAPFIFAIHQNEWFWKEAILAMFIGMSYLFYKGKTVFKTPYQPIILVVLALFSYLSILPGWYYRPHYFLYVHPALALLTGYSLAWFYSICQDKALKMVYMLLLAVSLGTSIYDQFPYIGKYKNSEFVNLQYGYDYFNEMREVGQVLKLNSQPDDKIGQVANEPQVNFYADLKAASGYLYNYPFYEKQRFATPMLEQFFTEMDKNQPRWFIKNIADVPWKNDNKQRMQDWVTQFEKAYILRGVVFGKNEWEKTVKWNVSKIDSPQGWEPAFLIFERGDSATVKALILENKSTKN